MKKILFIASFFLVLVGCEKKELPVIDKESGRIESSSSTANSTNDIYESTTEKEKRIEDDNNNLTEDEQKLETYNSLPESVKVYLANTAANEIPPGSPVDLTEGAYDLEYYFADDALIIRNIPSRSSMAATYYYLRYDDENIIMDHEVSRNSTSIAEDLIVQKRDLGNKYISKLDLFETYLVNKEEFDFGLRDVVSNVGVYNGYKGLIEYEK